MSAYIENFARDFFTRLTLAERRHVLKAGDRWPTSALSILANLPDDPGADLLAELRQLNGRIRPLCKGSDTFRRLRVGIIAALGRYGDQESLAYLYQLYHDEPNQRDVVAMSLTQQPEGESWSYLIDALKTAEGQSARSILIALAKVPQRPQQHEAYRQVILQGLRTWRKRCRRSDRFTQFLVGSGNHQLKRRLATASGGLAAVVYQTVPRCPGSSVAC